MSEAKNPIFERVTDLSRSFSRELTPESVIFGYSKLLLMDDSGLRSLFSEEEVAELNETKKVFGKNNLNIELIKAGISLFKKSLAEDETAQYAAKQFQAFLVTSQSLPSSAEIIEKALELSILPFAEIFAADSTFDKVFRYHKKMEEQGPTVNPFSGISPVRQPQTPKTELEHPEKTPSFYRFSDKYRELTGKLMEVVKGQDAAVMKFVQGCFHGDILKTTEKTREPRASFFFFGPPGVGKTLLAKTAAEVFERPYRIFSMSEYADEKSYLDLIGSGKLFSQSQPGTLTTFVMKNPESILIFDEIEKAHFSTIRLFLQILGNGVLHDAHHDQDVSFADTIVIFTSNAGKSLYENSNVNLTALPNKVIISAIRKETDEYGQRLFPAELCSRIASGNAIMFNHLSVNFLKDIVSGRFDTFARHMKEEHGFDLTYSPQLPITFLYSQGSQLDARIASSLSLSFLKDEVYELVRQLGKITSNESIRNIHFGIDLDNTEPDISRLFHHPERAEVLMVCDQERFALFNEHPGIRLYHAMSREQAIKYLRRDLEAIFIDPLYSSETYEVNPISIADYNTTGVRLFHELAELQSEIPIYIMDMNGSLTEIDKQTFIMEGAVDTIAVHVDAPVDFEKQMQEIVYDLYMQKESVGFTSKGWVLDYKTRQELSDDGTKVSIVLYDLKKKRAIDADSRSAVLSDADRPTVKFADVIGAENAKEELQYYINYLKHPKDFLMDGRKPPKGILLYGPPGTGKTMLARAMAGESDVTFLQTSASEFGSKWVGESEANVRRLFDNAKRYAPAIIFIDEIDAIGRQRTGQDPHTESVLNALLTQMDGFMQNPSKPVFVLAATNYGVSASSDSIAALDEALMRRFDNKIKIDLPNQNERLQFIEKKVVELKAGVSRDVQKNVAERTTGKSLAELANIIDLAYRSAMRRQHPFSDDDLLTSLEDYLFGEKRTHGEDYYRKVAVHEMGHALAAYLTGNPPSYITIESRGDFGGYMQHGNMEDVPEYTRDELLDMMCVSLAGRAAETVFFGKEKANNTGASSDLKKATDIAFNVVCKYGMEEGKLVVLSRDEVMRSSMAQDYIQQVNSLLLEQMEKTKHMISENYGLLSALADTLVRESHLTGDQFAALINELKAD